MRYYKIMTHNTPHNSTKTIKLTKQAQGTLTKVLTMVESNQYCPEIIQQIDSVIGLLKSSKKELLAGHLSHCLIKKLTEDKDKTVDELLKIYNLCN